MKLSKKHIIFIIVVFFLMIAIIYRILNPFVQQEVNTLTFTGEKKSVKTDKAEHAILQAEKVESQTLVSKFLNKPEVSAKVYNDLFSTYKPPNKLAKKKKVNIPADRDIQNRQKLDIKKDSLQEIKEYITSYRVYGIYKSENTKAIFLAKNKLVLVAQTGDRLDGKYLIDDIQDNYIKIKALEFNETIRLDMREFNNE
ncbi:MAG: hypothetical protein PF690_00530 [Deltaproteobacteria bacterium]|nr:hypothetical protein [Deltaproteobacteria bacterium]